MKSETLWTLRSALALILFLCVLVLTSCARGTVRTPEPIPPEVLALLQPPPRPDASQLVPCPEPPPASDDRLPSLLRNQQVSADMAATCRDRYQGLIDAVRESVRYQDQRIERARNAISGKPDA